MSKTKPINVVLAALFVGIMLTFTFYFGIASLTDNKTVDQDSVVADMMFSDFCNAFYCDDDLLALPDTIDYLVFKSIDSKDIILGDNNFLFDAGEHENGYKGE